MDHSILFNQTDDEADDCHDSKNEEQNFSNFNCSRSNPAEAKDCSNQRDDQKDNRIMQHLNFLFLPDALLSPEIRWEPLKLGKYVEPQALSLVVLG